jgi:hypothetical protein
MMLTALDRFLHPEAGAFRNMVFILNIFDIGKKSQ